MPAHRVVRVDVRRDCVDRLKSCGPALDTQLRVQRAEEAFGDGIVATLSSPTHTGGDPVGREHPLRLGTGVWHALAGTMGHAGARTPPPEREVQRREDAPTP